MDYQNYTNWAPYYVTNHKLNLHSIRCVSNASFTFKSSSSFEISSSSSVAISSSSDNSYSSSDISSSSSGKAILSCDIKDYSKVQIGTQTWMAENFNCEVSGSKCYKDDPANCEKYGRLYDWTTAMALPEECKTKKCTSQINTPHQGICPKGWHVPSGKDWDSLYRFADGTNSTSSPYSSTNAGRVLKAKEGWNISIPNLDTYGFAALPGGYRSGGSDYPNPSYSNAGSYGYWWSTEEQGTNFAYERYMRAQDHIASNGGRDRAFMLSVRCIED
jgi:uncharacterized protein (TIGR02145 family)